MSEHDGHRQRIIAKLDSGILCEHELLEILLFNAVPRRNTNELAHRLLSAFGSMQGIFAADTTQLMNVDGIGSNIAAYLVCIGKVYRICKESENPMFPEKYEAKSFMKFISGKYAGMKSEVLEFYLFDEAHKLLFCKSFSINNEQRVIIEPEALTRILLDIKPHGMVAVHNHLRGNSFPSDADDRTTKQFQLICSYHNVAFCDHYIYSPAGIYSYYRSGKMTEINENFSIKGILDKGR